MSAGDIDRSIGNTFSTCPKDIPESKYYTLRIILVITLLVRRIYRKVDTIHSIEVHDISSPKDIPERDYHKLGVGEKR